MTAIQARIVGQWERLGLGVEEIAEEEGLDPVAVKSVLLAHCPNYREAEREGREEISNEELDQFLAAYKQLAICSEHDIVREKALRFLINEKKGRNDIVREISGMGNINVLVFNENLEAARKAIGRVVVKPVVIEGCVGVSEPAGDDREDRDNRLLVNNKTEPVGEGGAVSVENNKKQITRSEAERGG